MAILEPSGSLVWAGREEAPQAASGACLRLLRTGLGVSGLELEHATLFAADLGPGSFTGVRVGVTLAKALAYATGAQAAGADAFDLIDPEGTVVLPSKRGEWFIRRRGEPPERSIVLPSGRFLGFGMGGEIETYPDASRFAAIASGLSPVAPEMLMPRYLIEPSISKPRTPYGASSAH